MNFADVLREKRKARELTQEQLASAIGVSHVYISALERGVRPAPRHAVVVALAHTLETDSDELWAIARSEREANLRKRVRGQPTSLQRPIEKPGTSEIGPQQETAMEDLVARLRKLPAEERTRVTEALLALLDALTR